MMRFAKVEQICENCRFQESCRDRNPELEDDDTCNDWEDNDPQHRLTEAEKAGIIGDMEAHRIMVEGRNEL